MNAEALAFYALAAMVLVGGFLVVQSRNLVHAAISLVPTLLGVAGLYVLLNAEFVTAIQILIYVGAITVLILFVILLTEGATGLRVRQRNEQVPLALLVCGILVVLFLVVLLRVPWGPPTGPMPAYNPGAVGRSFLMPYVLAFEVTSLVILASLVGAIVVARREG
ncbi:NADH-quinone oxidoreductase subunit J [bacterium HR32]|jgi:NADH:ubiquinone oxidoreductase subunit 6 (subunit J)|nr:NADH-quinone oxidoreductase subunit J [bacterium HR32]